jgi:hypothetical protein
MPPQAGGIASPSPWLPRAFFFWIHL